MHVMASEHPQIDNTTSLLNMLALESGADGVALLGNEPSGESLLVIECHPEFAAGRRIPVVDRFAEQAGRGLIAGDAIILPAAFIHWLGWRPSQIFLHALRFPNFNGCLLFCWRSGALDDSPPLAPILAEAANILPSLIERHLATLEQRRLAHQFEAIMSNVGLGIAFTDATGRSTVNPVAAALLDIPSGTGDAATLAAAMQDKRNHCLVRPSYAADNIGMVAAPDLATQGLAEYWTFPVKDTAGAKVVRLESHAVGDTETPGRFWLFTDVTQLWEAAERMQSINSELQRNNAQLAQEIEKRAQVEAALREREVELRRYAEDLEFTRSSIESQAHQAVELAEELSQQKQELEDSKRQSDYLANHDPLTGLFNRRAFRHHLQQMMDVARGTKAQVAMLFIDLDKFKMVNDSLGHDAGDQLLKKVAQILTDALRETDLLARFGGDEFAIATRIPSTSDLSKITGLAERIRQRLEIPMPTSTGTIHVCGTIGIGIYPTDADNMDDLFICADQAMYAGKKRGRNMVVLFKDMPKDTEPGSGRV